MPTFIGVDPGGSEAFGWCVIEIDDPVLGIKNLRSGTGSKVDEVVDEIGKFSREAPSGAGIDAPLYWTRTGERVSDQEIRKAVSRAGGHSAMVMHVNSLRGACLVQGVLAAVALTQRWREIQITESHPKALLRVWPSAKDFIAPFKFKNDHERDATLGAYAAFANWQKIPGWIDWCSVEKYPFFPSGGRVSYWFPRDMKSNPALQPPVGGAPEDRRRSG